MLAKKWLYVGFTSALALFSLAACQVAAKTNPSIPQETVPVVSPTPTVPITEVPVVTESELTLAGSTPVEVVGFESNPSLTPEPTEVPLTLERWAEQTPVDKQLFDMVVENYTKTMGISVESLETSIALQNGVNGQFALIVDKKTNYPLFIANETTQWKAATLDNAAQAKLGWRFGANGNFNRDFRELTLDNFGMANTYITWGLVQAQKGVWDFSDPDYNIETAHNGGMTVMAPLIWGNNIADWVKTEPDLHTVMIEYITQVMGHYKEEVDMWSVYNEATLHGDDDLFWNRLGGMQAVRDAYCTARAINPKATLLYNDFVDVDGTYDVESDRLPTIKEVVSQIQQDGNLDGIALQIVVSRMKTFDPDKIRRALDALSEFNLPIYIPEFSIFIKGENTPENLAEQARVGAEVIRVLKEYPNVRGIVAFPLEDRLANKIYKSPNTNSGLWLKQKDGTYIPKPIVYEMMRELVADDLGATP